MAKDMVDRGQLHKLFLSGKPLREIAKELGSTHGSIRTMIYHERLRNPLEWPVRVTYPGKSEAPVLMMHLYECEDCFVNFAVEDYDGIDHSATVCPICGTDEMLVDKGFGKFALTSTSTVNRGA
ncbi:hypothetical protein DFQ01_121108 [Paenibacillus cellulosilyticus]|uniref:Uncharacterized protein n=1 Tax=Paenibacillus cellulosilyticus TaxID=375489 RepID=A0A2V2YQ24_9BACL|nr:hypothetical protein [Paenibacillus cellulosilyticus]PWV97464.1 hypothetical protein DFQ01_121108 [Paenibacillus cellulosilyticus]QKS48499.1 hypothetical protein HUB94_30150 [Paenibacillus cellulosilyticus]